MYIGLEIMFRLRKFQIRTRTLLVFGLEPMCVTPWQKVFLYFCRVYCVLTLWETEIKSDRLIDLVKETQRHAGFRYGISRSGFS